MFPAAQNLRMIYLHLNERSNNSISSEMFQLPKDVEQFGEFLRLFNLKRFNLNVSQHIVLDTANTYRFCIIKVFYHIFFKAATTVTGNTLSTIQSTKLSLYCGKLRLSGKYISINFLYF